MIPIRDDQPSFTTPFINYLLIALNTLVFLFEVSLSPATRNAFVFQFGVEPIRVLAGLGLAAAHVPDPSALPLFTSMFLHASWLHLIGNMWVLWIFGDNIEDTLGHFGYMVFYLVSGLAASLLHIFLNPNSTVPDRKSTRLNSSHLGISYAVFCLKKK